MPTTPAGTAYTVYAFTAGGESAWRAVADSQVGATNIPAVLFCHGNPGAVVTDADQQFGAGYTTVRNWLIDNGWAYIEGHGAGANWGNQASRTAYEAMWSATAAAWNLGRVVVIGRSMGALVGAWLASESIIAPHCAGFISLSGTADLSNRYASASAGDKTNMHAAYGVSDETGWRASVAAFDPMLASLSSWDDRNAIMQWDTSDTTVPYASNGQAWDAKYGPRLNLRRTQSTTGGDHNSTPNNATHTAATIAFLEDAELPAGIWSDTWSDTWGTASVSTTAAGALVLSGSAARSIVVTRAAAGVLVLSGSAEHALSITTSAVGILTITGHASTSGGTDRNATGALTIQGTATVVASITRVATGTLTLIGSGATAVDVARDANGTLALGGIGTITYEIVRAAIGILTLTGVGATETRPLPPQLTLTEIPVSHTFTEVTLSHTLEDA